MSAQNVSSNNLMMMMATTPSTLTSTMTANHQNDSLISYPKVELWYQAIVYSLTIPLFFITTAGLTI